MAKKKSNNLWYILGGVIIIILLVLIMGRQYIAFYPSPEKEALNFDTDCEFGSEGRTQFGGGTDAIVCKFRNLGEEISEVCFNIYEIKTDAGEERIIGEHKLCSGKLNSYQWSEEKYIYDSKSYEEFNSGICNLQDYSGEGLGCGVIGKTINYNLRVEMIE